MVQQHNNPGSLVGQDGTGDAVDSLGLSQPYSQNEIDDLHFGTDRPVEERIARLQEIRADLVTQESGDFGEQDPLGMIAEIDNALADLQGDLEDADNNPEFAGATADDPSDHLDALAPDDIEARAALTGEDGLYEDDEDGPADDDNVWSGSEEFRRDN